MAELSARIIAKASATAAEEPQASDLEVAELAVNTADGKLFTKHTDGSVVTISGGGTASAVDSVNGETGVVSLGIQDMDDFQFALGTPPSNRFNSYSLALSVDGEWAQDGTGLYSRKVDSDSNSIETQANYGGNDIWYSQDGVNWTAASGTFTDFTTHARWSIGNPGLNTGGSLYLTFTDPSTVPAPIVDGEILQWVDADQKFKPTPLHVDISVEDLSNVSNNVKGNLYDDKIVPQASSSADGPGQYDARGTGILLLSDINADGVNINAYHSTWTLGDAISFYDGTDGSLIYSTTISNAPTHSGGVIYFNLTNYDGWAAVQATTSLVVQNDTRPTTDTGYGARDGQALTWVDANNQWEPADVAGGGAVDSVNDQTGVVSLGVQDMDDFALSLNGQVAFHDAKQGEDNPGGVVSNVDGAFSFNTTSNIYINRVTPTSGVSLDSQGFLAGDTVLWVSADGINYTEHISAGSFDNNGVAYFYSLSPTLDAYATADALYFSLSNPVTSLTEGDTLQWNSADQKFNPAQVPTRIQDQDDLETPAVFRYIKGVDSSPSNPGQFYYITTNLKINQDDADGNDAGLGSATELWMSIDGGATWEYHNLGSPVPEFSHYTWSGLNGDGSEFPLVYAALAGTEVLVTTQPPLADGVVLAWDSTANAFKPTLDYVHLSTLKTEVAASADFADFQARIAAL